MESRQSKMMSAVEAVANVVVGFCLALIAQVVVFPLFGLATTIADNVILSGIFTGISLLRSFALRRLFESLRSYGA